MGSFAFPTTDIHGLDIVDGNPTSAHTELFLSDKHGTVYKPGSVHSLSVKEVLPDHQKQNTKGPNGRNAIPKSDFRKNVESYESDTINDKGPNGRNAIPESEFRKNVESYEFNTKKNNIGKHDGHLVWQKLESGVLFAFLQNMDLQSSLDSHLYVLEKCRESKNDIFAKSAYVYACHAGLDIHPVLGNFLVPTFVECICLTEAEQLLNRLVIRNEHSWTSFIQGCIERGNEHDAFELFKRMECDFVQPSRFTYVALLKACARVKDQVRGQEMHMEITKQGFETDSFIGNILMDMYSKSGCILETQRLFNTLPIQDIVSWNTLIASLVDHGHDEEALRQLWDMQVHCTSPNHITYICGLKASSNMGSLASGQLIHADATKEGYEGAFNVGTSLIDMYVKCGSFIEAREVFDNLNVQDAVSWNPLIMGYVEQGLGEEALSCFQEMKLQGIPTDTVVVSSCIKACGTIGSINTGYAIHTEAIKLGFEKDPFVGSSMLDMYAKLQSFDDAKLVFSQMPFHGVVTWTTLISGYVECGLGEEALNCLDQMSLEGVSPNDVTLICCLKACGSIPVPGEGQEMHAIVTKKGYERDPVVGCALVDMYVKCGTLLEAQAMLSRMPSRDVAAWTSLISGYAEQGLVDDALTCLRQMQAEGVFPNEITFGCMLKACCSSKAIKVGLELHYSVVIQGLEQEAFICSALVHMYALCGYLDDACIAFNGLKSRDVNAWGALINGYLNQGEFEGALTCFQQMQVDAICPDVSTLVAVLKACAGLQNMEIGGEIILQITKKGFDSDPCICTTTADFYAKRGLLIEAAEEFKKLLVKDVVSWTSLIGGYAEHGFGKEAFDCYVQMKSEGVLPDEGTFVCCLKACSSIGAIDKGQEIHMEIAINGFESDIQVGNTLVHFYAKCGWLTEAREVFDELHIQDVVSYTALIRGYAEHGNQIEALNCFQQMQLNGTSSDLISWNNLIFGYGEQSECEMAYKVFSLMQEQGLLPNEVTIANTLKACGGIASLEIGKRLVTQICQGVGLNAIDVASASSIVDMFSRCGNMVLAQQAFDSMPSKELATWNGLIMGYARQGETELVCNLLDQMRAEGMHPNEVTLLSVLISCNHAGLVDIGKKYFNAMKTEFQLVPGITHYNCLIDLYGRAGRIDELITLLQEMPTEPNYVTWITILSACQKWGNVNLSKQAFENLVRMDSTNTATYIMMTNIYGNAYMWDEVKKIEAKMFNTKSEISINSEKTWVEIDGVVHAFVSSKTLQFRKAMLSSAQRNKSDQHPDDCLPNFVQILQGRNASEKVETLCAYATQPYNSESPVVASSDASSTIRIVNKLWNCGKCHDNIMVLSKKGNFTVVVRDANRTHVFKDGKCSCVKY